MHMYSLLQYLPYSCTTVAEPLPAAAAARSPSSTVSMSSRTHVRLVDDPDAPPLRNASDLRNRCTQTICGVALEQLAAERREVPETVDLALKRIPEWKTSPVDASGG